MRVLPFSLLAALALAGCHGSGESFRNSDITGADYGRDFSLTDQNGKTRTLADFRGKVVVVFFGYTRCPDVCPTTLAEMASAVKQLGDRGREVQVLFVTLDPKRDTGELIKQYAAAFDPGFVGLRGPPSPFPNGAEPFFKRVSTRSTMQSPLLRDTL